MRTNRQGLCEKIDALAAILLASVLSSCSSQMTGRAPMVVASPTVGALTATAAIRPSETALPPVFTATATAPQPTKIPTQFEVDVQSGKICKGSLAVEHSFSVFVTDADKSGLVELDEQRSVAELRSFSWSPDGRQLAIVGNNMGDGNIYVFSAGDDQLRPLISDPAVTSSREFDYLDDVRWSDDGQVLITWGHPQNSEIYLVQKNGSGFTPKHLPLKFLEMPQFAPGNLSLVFYGADQSGAGLFRVDLNNDQVQKMNAQVGAAGSFAWSQDGTRLAYIETDRQKGEARLVIGDQATETVIAALPGAKGSTSSKAGAANLNWSPDGKLVVFELEDGGATTSGPSIYLAFTGGSQVTKLAESAHAPAISADGRCLAYIRDKQIFLLDLAAAGSDAEPALLADLPKGRGPDGRVLDELQWQPNP